MIYSADGLWERLKKRSRRLRLADQTQTDTHLHHSFVTVLVGGGIGFVLLTLASFALPVLPELTAQTKLAVGCGVANGCYLIREIEARWTHWRYSLWDGLLDVLVPACFWIPAATGSLAVLYVLLGVYCVAFFCFRPVE